MRCRERLLRLKKGTAFRVKEVEALTGFSRGQLEKWEEYVIRDSVSPRLFMIEYSDREKLKQHWVFAHDCIVLSCF